MAKKKLEQNIEYIDAEHLSENDQIDDSKYKLTWQEIKDFHEEVTELYLRFEDSPYNLQRLIDFSDMMHCAGSFSIKSTASVLEDSCHKVIWSGEYDLETHEKFIRHVGILRKRSGILHSYVKPESQIIISAYDEGNELTTLPYYKLLMRVIFLYRRSVHLHTNLYYSICPNLATMFDNEGHDLFPYRNLRLNYHDNQQIIHFDMNRTFTAFNVNKVGKMRNPILSLLARGGNEYYNLFPHNIFPEEAIEIPKE